MVQADDLMFLPEPGDIDIDPPEILEEEANNVVREYQPQSGNDPPNNNPSAGNNSTGNVTNSDNNAHNS